MKKLWIILIFIFLGCKIHFSPTIKGTLNMNKKTIPDTTKTKCHDKNIKQNSIRH